MVRTLRVLALAWLCLFCLVFCASAGFEVYSAPTIWRGISTVLDWLNPWNVSSAIVNVLSVAPGLLLWHWAGKIEARRSSP